MGVERGVKGSPWILKLLAKKVVFSISGGKKQILPLLAPPGNFWENPLLAPMEKFLPTPMLETAFI